MFPRSYNHNKVLVDKQDSRIISPKNFPNYPHISSRILGTDLSSYFALQKQDQSLGSSYNSVHQLNRNTQTTGTT